VTGPLLEVRNLEVGYGRTRVLHGLSIELGTHRRIGLIGPNGHGKTTLLRAISGLLTPWSGEILLEGQRIGGRDPAAIVAEGLIHVPQANALFPYMTVAENLGLGAYVKRARAKKTETLKEVYELFPRLWERRSQECRTLSGGERQMVSIGAALMAQPKILMLDEPTLGLSPKLKAELCDAIDGISQTGVPTIVVEQDISFMLRLTDYFYLVHQGQVSAEFSSSDKLDNSQIMDMYLGMD
jgi:branched-chain amino acid transport system ATP-binding protein